MNYFRCIIFVVEYCKNCLYYRMIYKCNFFIKDIEIMI